MHEDDASSDGFSRCFLAPYNAAATIDAIGTYDALFGLDETVAMMLCERHAEAVEDVVVLVTID